MHIIENCPRNSRWHENVSTPSGSWVIDQNIILTVLIHNLKTAWSTEISMPFIFPWTIYFKMHASFFEKVLIILRLHTKYANFKLGLQYPLRGVQHLWTLFLKTMYIFSKNRATLILWIWSEMFKGTQKSQLRGDNCMLYAHRP